MTDLAVFALLCAGLYYLLARAEITRWLWQPLDGVRLIGPLLRCPACSGTWIGIPVGWYVEPVAIGRGWHGTVEFTLTCMLLGMVLTAVAFGAMKWGLDVGAVSD